MDKLPIYSASDFVPHKRISRTPGQTVSSLRKLNEWSQPELGEKPGISIATISFIETGKTTLNAERAEIIANAFNIHPGVVLLSEQ